MNPYATFWDRTLGRQNAYLTGLRQGRAETQDILNRSVVVSCHGEHPAAGSDTRRAVRFATALAHIHLMVFGHRPDPLSVEAALHALGVHAHPWQRQRETA